jgi:hypothetical protein
VRQFPQEAPKAMDRSLDELAKIIQNMPPVSARANGFGAIGIAVGTPESGPWRPV